MRPEQAPAGEETIDLQPREFGVALLMAATWYFAGPWGLLPTLWFLALIVKEPPRWLAQSSHLLPVRARRALAARGEALGASWRQLSAPWRGEPAWGDDDPLAAALGLPATPGDHALPLIDVATLARSDNLLIVGNRGSGKTTLLQALLAHRPQRCYVLDPHNHPGKWPAAVRVIGGGRAFASIYQALLSSEGQLDARRCVKSGAKWSARHPDLPKP